MVLHSSSKAWGLLPSDVRALILKREWDNEAGLKARLLNQKPFPIRIGLKPPTERSAIADMTHFQTFIREWRSYAVQKHTQWKSRHYRVISEQNVPTFFVLENLKELIEFVGKEAISRSERWMECMTPMLLINEALYPVLVKHLKTVERMRLSDAELLSGLVKQLSFQMGVGQYLRALPLEGIDTKFLENHQTLISDMLDVLHEGAITKNGGLLEWLGCLKNPKGWLTVRPLCDVVKANLGGFPVMQLHSDVLREQALPANNILVVENMQSGLGLPLLKDTIAVFGGGKNVSWMDASWLKSKRVAYWGDIDSWGLHILSDVRAKLETVEAIMMDSETLRQHEDRMVIEPEPLEALPKWLTSTETQLFLELKSGAYSGTRLEQERLSPDYIHTKLNNWAIKKASRLTG
ncbi:FIG005429: hypothetical protein [hydrothermal vent metagenome]|uniref:Wadjet protein JetD C-terminal domain-containing protein n=1 Tax=hydrothermal vent metagenome TaxID=652676 RepID=A0A3B0VSP2_9ZZZZ